MSYLARPNRPYRGSHRPAAFPETESEWRRKPEIPMAKKPEDRLLLGLFGLCFDVSFMDIRFFDIIY